MKNKTVYCMKDGSIFTVICSDVFEFWDWMKTFPSGEYALLDGHNFQQYFTI